MRLQQSACIQSADQFIFQSTYLLRKIIALSELLSLYSSFSE